VISLTVTGHRPPKIGGYSRVNPIRQALRAEYARIIRELEPEEGISGMAQGVDQDFAEVLLTFGVRLIAAVPFPGQEVQWPMEARQRYHEILSRAWEVQIISEEFTPQAMQRRNIWMVDRCSHVLAVWNGSGGGTANCVRYAEKQKKPIIRIHPEELLRAD
jgi:uncharacterized phage-like protein YoqJ